MTKKRLELVRDRSAKAHTPFEALLHAATHDPSAASGLALAYGDMVLEARSKLLDEITGDDAGVDLGEHADVLLLFLGVEEDPAIAQRIADALLSVASQAGPGRDAAFGWGDRASGGVGIVRHLHGEFADALRVTWTGESLDAESLFMTDAADLDRLRKRTSIPPVAQQVPFELAVDALAEALWRHRRSGRQMPPEVRPFAELFSLPRRP